MNYRELTPDQIAELEQLYPVTTNRELAARFDISVDALTDYIAAPRGWRKNLKAVLTGSRGGRTLAGRELEWFIRHYKHTKNKDIMQRLNIGESQLHRLARKYGLRKSRQQLAKNQAEATAAARQVCTDYGIYRETSRRMKRTMADLRARGQRWPGSFQPGVTSLQRLGPKRNRERIEKARTRRNETIRKENMRLKYGLERKTRLIFIVGCRYTKSQLNHRYHAIRRGYILADDCSEAGGHRYTIYYDDQTPRSPKFEQNLTADGFTIQPWPYE